ncbi:EF-hand domain-containing protein [bacterium]|nr:EF-hand domain-containing protein [bacterium]
MDLSEINTLISQPKLTKSMPHKRSPSVYSSSSSPSSTLRLLKQIRMRLDGEDFRKHQRKEVPYDKEAEAKMASDLHMTVEELEQFEELSENVQTDQKKYMEIFEKFDADQSGTLSDSELRNALNAIGENMSEQELQELKQKTDGNGDGHFDYHEFVDLLNARKRIAALASSMLRSSTTTSDFQRHTVKRRAPPQLPRLRVPTDLQSRRNMRSVDAFLPRPTPKILKPGRKQKIKVSEMKRQLEISKRALQDSDEHIKRNLEWIRGHCPVTNIRAQLFMQKWGMLSLSIFHPRPSHLQPIHTHTHRCPKT